MFKNNKEKKIANKITKILQMRGFIVDMQVSKKTNSIYLKIDNGACDGIRISDHINNLTKYKFNMIRNYHGRRSELSNGKYKLFYSFTNTGRLINDLEVERSNNIMRNGYYNYRKLRDKKTTTLNNSIYSRKAA